MDTHEQYQRAIESALIPYAERCYSDTGVANEAVFDRNHDHYLIVSVGWQGIRRIQHCLLHLDIINGKVWIQRDGTEDSMPMNWKQQAFPNPILYWRSTRRKIAP